MSLIPRNKGERIKVAIVVPKYGLLGGGERFASIITGILAKNESMQFHVFANRWVSNSSRIQFHKVPTIPFPRFLRPLSFSFFAQHMIDQGKFDIVHSHDRMFRADVFSVHCVPHGGWVRNIRGKRQSLFDRSLAGIERSMMRANAESWFLPVSSLAMDAFIKEYTTLPGKWDVFHPGVDVSQFSSPSRDSCRREIRQRYGISESAFLILFVGMNFEVKGLHTIIEALAKARTVRPDADLKLLVVGRGNLQKYNALARSLGTCDAVVFAGPQNEGIEHYYRAADVFMMLSVFDTFGMVVLEAMAAGLPVIISSTVGAKDLIDDGVNGFVIPEQSDSDSAAERIVRLLDGNTREEMGAASMRIAFGNDWSRLASRMEMVYQEVLDRKLPASAQRGR